MIGVIDFSRYNYLKWNYIFVYIKFNDLMIVERYLSNI